MCGNPSEEAFVKALYKSLIAEAKSPASVGRIVIEVELSGRCVVLNLRADTESHLRAVINSMLYLIHAVKEVIERVGESPRS